MKFKSILVILDLWSKKMKKKKKKFKSICFGHSRFVVNENEKKKEDKIALKKSTKIYFGHSRFVVQKNEKKKEKKFNVLVLIRNRGMCVTRSMIDYKIWRIPNTTRQGTFFNEKNTDIFLISPRKHVSWRNKKNIYLILLLSAAMFFVSTISTWLFVTRRVSSYLVIAFVFQTYDLKVMNI